MPRNLRSEILVAVITVLGLGGAIAFGIFLSSQNPDGEIDANPTIIAENPTQEEFTASNVIDDDSQLTPTFDVTLDISLTEATEELETQMSGETNTATEITEMAVETEVTVTVVETDEDESTATESFTATLRPSRTPTMTATITSSPTMTNTATQTFTPTLTFTPSNTPTPTRTARPVEQENILPTPSSVVDITPDDDIEVTEDVTSSTEQDLSVNSYGCTSPEDWSNYIVQVGNTLFSIAQAVRSTVSELRDANCLPNANQIIVGDVLFVPNSPAQPVQTNVPADSSTVVNPTIGSGGLYSLGCISPAVQITSPAIGQQVSGVFTVSGVATYDSAFGYYRLEIRPDEAVTFSFYARSETPVVGGALGQIDSGLFNSGLYWLRLTVVDATGNVRDDATCVIPIIID